MGQVNVVRWLGIALFGSLLVSVLLQHSTERFNGAALDLAYRHIGNDTHGP